MSAQEEPKDETWVTEDGTEILVGDLTEDHAKNILRMILKDQRKRNEFFQSMVLPQLGSILSEISNGASCGIVEIDFNGESEESKMSSIDEMFLKAGASITKTKH